MVDVFICIFVHIKINQQMMERLMPVTWNHRVLLIEEHGGAPGEAGAVQPVKVRSGKGVAPAR